MERFFFIKPTLFRQWDILGDSMRSKLQNGWRRMNLEDQVRAYSSDMEAVADLLRHRDMMAKKWYMYIPFLRWLGSLTVQRQLQWYSLLQSFLINVVLLMVVLRTDDSVLTGRLAGRVNMTMQGQTNLMLVAPESFPDYLDVAFFKSYLTIAPRMLTTEAPCIKYNKYPFYVLKYAYYLYF